MTSEWPSLPASLPNPDEGTLGPGLAETRIAFSWDQGLLMAYQKALFRVEISPAPCTWPGLGKQGCSLVLGWRGPSRDTGGPG